MDRLKQIITPHLKVGALAALLGVSVLGGHAFAADHVEAPGSQADPAADISDFYLWATQRGTVVAVLNFAGLAEAGSEATYDADVLYGLHIDNDDDNVADIDVWVRFGQNGAGEWGLQVTNLPGADAAVDPVICAGAGQCGPVDTVIDTGAGTKIFAGPRDDPFFFDLDGYLATLDTGTVSFDSTNDTFAGTNVTSIVLEMDAVAAADGASAFQAWVTTSRL